MLTRTRMDRFQQLLPRLKQQQQVQATGGPSAGAARSTHHQDIVDSIQEQYYTVQYSTVQ